MKKGIATLFFLLSSFHFIFSSESDFKFSIGTWFGPSNTIIYERLLDQDAKNAETSSLLKWESFGIPSFDTSADFFLFKKMYINLGGFFVIPASSGKMQDYDWLNLFSTGGKELTHYSIHDNCLDTFFHVNTSVGYIFKPINKLNIIPFISFRYSYQSFTSTDGYRQYGANIGSQNGNNVYEPWTPDIPKTQLEGKIITLEEQNYFFGIGTQINFELADRLNASLLLQLLPSIKSNALDTHHRRKTKYTLFENTNKLALDSSFLLQYKISDLHRLSFKAGYCYSFADGINLYQSATKNSWNGVVNPGKLNQHDFTLSAGYTYYYEK